MANETGSAAKEFTAAIIVIGDEILKGHVRDSNSHFLSKELWGLGVKVAKIVFLPDDVQTIAAEVRTAAPLYDFVITTGGVGPTHDDITMEAIGSAFSEELAPHPDILRFLFQGDPNGSTNLTHPWRKMAMVPKSTKVHFKDPVDEDAFTFILLAVHNVHCYPGLPSLMRELFLQWKELYSGSGASFYLKEVFFGCDEDVLVEPLTAVQKEYPQVQVGSYPDDSTSNAYRVRVALEARDRKLVEEAYVKLVFSVPVSVLISSKTNYDQSEVTEGRKAVVSSLSLSPNKASLLPGATCCKIQNSMATLEKALREYSTTGLCVAFNGGKDCTVILSLLRALLTRLGDDSKISILYVIENEQFSEVQSFVQSTIESHRLNVFKFSGTIKQALAQLATSHPEVKAICMGTRRTDPFSADLEAFSVTDKTWPQYMRVNCILEWSYRDIWLYLRLCEVPYCKLYDQGYTSLDGIADTHPNPSLLRAVSSSAPSSLPSSEQSSSSAKKSYLPAYLLTDQQLERAGRTSKSANL